MLKKFLLVLMAIMMVFTMIPTVAMAEVNDDGVSTEFQAMLDKVLDKDGKLVIKCVEPANEDAMGILCWAGMPYFYPELCDNEFYVSPVAESTEGEYKITSLTSVIIGYTSTSEKKEVPVKYVYDSAIVDDVQKFIDKLPTDGSLFEVSDLELINYLVNFDSSIYDEANYVIDPLANYSGELKATLKNTNMFMDVENGAGLNSAFYIERLGTAFFGYSDIVYKLSDQLGARGNHVIYVPENTDDLVKAAQKRIDEYIGTGYATVSSAGKTLEQAYNAWIEAEYENTRPYWKEENPDWTIDDWKAAYLPSYDNIEDAIGISGVNKDAPAFIVKIGKEEYYFTIIKDSSKMITPTYSSADLKTNVAVATSSSQVPLDTMIDVKNVTSGTEYDRIMKVLDVENSKTFDIKLHSASKDDYVTKLDNGKFEVKIPIDKQFEGKKLVVYYVDANGKTTEHAVTVKGGFATFETDHFSIYTLAEAKGSSVPPTPSGRPTPLEPSLPKKEIKVDGSKADIPANIVNDLIKAKEPLTINSPVASFSLDDKALTALSKNANGTNLEFNVAEIRKDDMSLTDAQKKALKSITVAKLISAEILDANGNEVSKDFGGGKAKVTIPFKSAAGKNVKHYSVIHIHDDGDMERIPIDKVDGNGNVIVSVEHFSVYAVVLSADVAHIPLAGETPKTGDTSGLAGWAMLAVLAAGTAVFAKRRRED